VWSETELVKNIEEIHHPTVRNALKFLRVEDGIELFHHGDLPARTGMGTSSAFTVGLLTALYGLQGRMCTKLQLAHEAIHIERDMNGENVGCQDQTHAAFGGFNEIEFQPDGMIRIKPVILCENRLQEFHDHLMLLFTGFSRTASEIAAEQVRETPKHTRELSDMMDMVHQGVYILSSDTDIREFGLLLDKSWQLKRKLSSSITNPEIDRLYDMAKYAGAIGGKLLGAGGGGFMLLFVEPDKQDKVRQTLGLMQVPFKFERGGSQIIHYD
jgi:D-glycero-alpha-D-manno-heptose-7-phosphate kinase